MKIDIVTLFPDFYTSPLNTSIIKRAQDKGLVSFTLKNIRDHAKDKHRTADDTPYGGGPGMVMKPDLVFEAVESLERLPNHHIILTCPQGEMLSQAKSVQLAKSEQLIIICGHYEGVDERVAQYLATDRISIGNYVLSGGEIASLVIIDSVVRLIPGVLGNDESAINDSFMNGLLDCPHYTRPYDFRGWKVPDILLSGNHQEIDKWRKDQMLKNTMSRQHS